MNASERDSPRRPGAKPHPMEGRHVRLVTIVDPYTDLRPGATGTVFSVDDSGTIHVAWDDGHTLGLVPGVDAWEVVVTCPFCGAWRVDTEQGSRDHLLTECPELDDDDRKAALSGPRHPMDPPDWW